jgi:hypothetical protein
LEAQAAFRPQRAREGVCVSEREKERGAISTRLPSLAVASYTGFSRTQYCNNGQHVAQWAVRFQAARNDSTQANY